MAADRYIPHNRQRFRLERIVPGGEKTDTLSLIDAGNLSARADAAQVLFVIIVASKEQILSFCPQQRHWQLLKDQSMPFSVSVELKPTCRLS